MNPRHTIQEQLSQELLDYICGCFKEILGGEKADISLNLTTGKKGRRKKDSQQVEKEVGVAYHVSQLMKKTSLEDAAEIIAAKENSPRQEQRTAVALAVASKLPPMG